MQTVKIEAKIRGKKGKGASNRARKEGYIPAIIYGKNMDNVAIAVLENEMEKILNRVGENVLFNLSIDGDAQDYTVLIKEIQRNPVKGTLSHIDFYQVSMTDKINTLVNISLVGESIGVSKGGILQLLTRELEIRCLPADIPSSIEVDISNLEIGDALLVADIEPSDKFEIITDDNTVIVSIAAPQIEEETDEEVEESAEATEAADETEEA
jgi:large subunit ribosomal protein L25